MPFVAVSQMPKTRTDWTGITHIHLISGRRPQTAGALARWRALTAAADGTGLVRLEAALSLIEPIRQLAGGREAAIRSDLRCWSNPVDHGNNNQDKGWLELGYLITS